MDGGPFMHSVHFCYAFGCFVAPMIAAPFLKQLGQIELPYPGVKQLYVLASVPVILVSFGYLVLPAIFPELKEKLNSPRKQDAYIILIRQLTSFFRKC